MRAGNIWLLGLLAIASPAMAQGDDSLDARRDAARQLLEARGEDKVLDAMTSVAAKIYIERLHKRNPEISQERLDALSAAIKADLLANQDDYLKPETEMLAQHMTVEELRAVTDFYRTPTGKRLSALVPNLYPDIAKAQDAWISAAIVKATNDINAKATK